MMSRSLIVVGAVCAALVPAAAFAEPAACLSSDPAQWPAPSRPYFMVAFDTSSSMTTAVTGTNSCGYPNDRLGHGRCALRNMFQAYGGEVNFGLASYAVVQSGCSFACFTNCTYSVFPGDTGGVGCGPGSGTTRQGANILVPLVSDLSTSPSNLPSLLQYADNNCSGSLELFAQGNTPLNGILRDMYRYLSNQWVSPANGTTYVSPLSSAAAGERACRTVNVILITDGDETCDTQADAVNAAAALNAGFTRNGITWSVKVHVINFAGGSVANTDQIAQAGGTGSSYSVSNEAQLAQALSNIVAGAIKPETCDNLDNNCNGCTDEGFQHFCNSQPVSTQCCSWATTAQRTTCLNTYAGTITPSNPGGDKTKLPCTTPTQQQNPTTWLCADPGERCDNVDNNCNGSVDESIRKCGSPLHCPAAETCNGQDDDCDGVIDNGISCSCSPTPEICDGCDNDCDGFTDNGVAPVACGQSSPANCSGTVTCKPPQAVPPGGCVAGGGPNACNNNPQAEVCDGIDNNCNGIVDDGVASSPCVPNGTPPNLNYGANSQCKQGRSTCSSGIVSCTGFVGPSPEICDGIDNNCNGQVDEGVSGLGAACGSNQPPCSAGVTACVGGVLVCQGGVRPAPEVCDGVDNDCDGTADEAPLSDAPTGANSGCWSLPGNCCTFGSLSWCPPPGAGCNGAGSLTSPCSAGVLSCGGSSGWVCQASSPPTAEQCDGIDNDCNGQADDGVLPGVGAVCGSSQAPCAVGVTECRGGALDCAGSINPVAETCDGVDNDCDGTVDEDLAVSGTCDAAYDTGLYPGVRNLGVCRQGAQECGGASGVICAGAVGPSPEICDGLDNDCDGRVDEPGQGPDGIDGSAIAGGNGTIGGACSGNGVCGGGLWSCRNGIPTCVGTAAQFERCDGLDNDCDGVVDNASTDGGPPLCGEGSDCLNDNGVTRCEETCTPGVTRCPGGQICNLNDNHCVDGPQPTPDGGPGGTPGSGAQTKSCGCASSTGGGSGNALFLIFALGLLVFRARRSTGGAR